MSKKRLTLGENIRRIREAKRQLKAGNIDKAIETSPCVDCKEKMRAMKRNIEKVKEQHTHNI